MENSTFFKSIWRFNAIVISIAGILAIFFLLYVGYRMGQDLFRDRQVANVVNITEDTNITEKWRLGHIKRIAGTNYALIPLETDQSYAQSHYSKSARAYRNFLFLDLLSNEQTWLFTHNKWLITTIEYVKQDRKSIAILYKIIKSDSDNNKRLTGNDKLTIAFSDPYGQQYRELLPAVDKFLGYEIIDNQQVLVLYQNENTGYTARFSVKNFSVLEENELVKIGNRS